MEVPETNKKTKLEASKSESKATEASTSESKTTEASMSESKTTKANTSKSKTTEPSTSASKTGEAVSKESVEDDSDTVTIKLEESPQFPSTTEIQPSNIASLKIESSEESDNVSSTFFNSQLVESCSAEESKRKNRKEASADDISPDIDSKANEQMSFFGIGNGNNHLLDSEKPDIDSIEVALAKMEEVKSECDLTEESNPDTNSNDSDNDNSSLSGCVKIPRKRKSISPDDIFDADTVPVAFDTNTIPDDTVQVSTMRSIFDQMPVLESRETISPSVESKSSSYVSSKYDSDNTEESESNSSSYVSSKYDSDNTEEPVTVVAKKPRSLSSPSTDCPDLWDWTKVQPRSPFTKSILTSDDLDEKAVSCQGKVTRKLGSILPCTDSEMARFRLSLANLDRIPNECGFHPISPITERDSSSSDEAARKPLIIESYRKTPKNYDCIYNSISAKYYDHCPRGFMLSDKDTSEEEVLRNTADEVRRNIEDEVIERFETASSSTDSMLSTLSDMREEEEDALNPQVEVPRFEPLSPSADSMSSLSLSVDYTGDIDEMANEKLESLKPATCSKTEPSKDAIACAKSTFLKRTKDTSVSTKDTSGSSTKDSSVSTKDSSVLTEESSVLDEESSVSTKDFAVSTKDSCVLTEESSVSTKDSPVSTKDFSVLTEEPSVSTKPELEKGGNETNTTATKLQTSEKSRELSVPISNVDQENSEDGGDREAENPIFVHVNTENEKEDDKNRIENYSQGIQDEEDFQNSQPQEDPIASDDFVPIRMEEENEDAEQGASEELCIIPDTERVISQEEKDAAAAMVPLRDPKDISIASTSKQITATKTSEASNEKYIISTCTDEKVNTCMQCCLPRKSKYSVMNNSKVYFICDDSCLKAFKEKYKDKVVINIERDLRVKKLTSGVNNDNMVAKVKFHRKCMDCEKKIVNDDFTLSWETMEFCNEFCLSKYQKRIGSNCANCQVEVRSNCLGKYCVRFGYDIRQFCSSACLEEYKKGLKVCTYCQKDMSRGGDGFLAPVGDKGQFKDFCAPQCMEMYDIMSNNREQPISTAGSVCSVCLNEKPITIEFELDNKMNFFCGEPCFVAFKFVNNITPGKCDMCRKYFDNTLLEEHSIHYDNAQHSFCSRSCQNIYIISHRKIVPCSWCRVKKYNFDMIKRNSSSGPITMCSLNCLSLYHVSVNAVNSKRIKCDHCLKNLQPLYHLTMSDATIRNFCSYTCVMAFQNQFPKTPITLNETEESSTPVPTSGPKRSKRANSKSTESLMPTDIPTIPVISSVQSLATTNGPKPVTTRPVITRAVNTRTVTTRLTRSKNNSDAAVKATATSPPVKTQIKQQIIIKPAPLPPQRNIATMCKVITANKGVSHKPATACKEVQTDEIPDKTAVIPIPVPIYVPSPLWMFSMPFPVPFPFPLPVPVPIFIPTTRNSATGIMKEIKKIQVKIPTDPFEAELLMMAEMVAGDKKEEHTDSESDEEDTTAPADEGTFSPEPVDASNTFGDDMLQMALKMATELDEPAVDLEGALTASTITASQGGESTVTEETVDDPQPIHHLMERQAVRGRKRPGRPPKSASNKRGRRASNTMDLPMMPPPQPPPPPEPAEKPDANMCLKYTFGVNAWKQWVTTKNAELEKSSRRVKLFKPEILQLTADELNYSLCLFVKEVRKPNGQEYAPDTIYYLCLGIQQYLFENGRIDNIFCDTYYEKFTDCLDDVAKKFSVLYNDSHYIVTRVEEEHLWESKQLGAHSPHVLLSTLMFFNTKHFNLTTVDEHMQLSFSHIMKHWKRNPNQPGTNKVAGSRNVLLRFYPPQTAADANARKKKVYEQQENEENPLRCPVKLYEFYLSKWYLYPESVKTRNDVFYLLPERSCVPDSPVWYSTMPLPRYALEKMLHRVKMVKEINVALLTS